MPLKKLGWTSGFHTRDDLPRAHRDEAELSVMICLLCNGDGSIGEVGGGSALQSVCCWGGGSTSKYKLGRGGGVAEEMTDLPADK